MRFVKNLYDEGGSGLKLVIISFQSILQLGFGEDWPASAMRLQCRNMFFRISTCSFHILRAWWCTPAVGQEVR